MRPFLIVLLVITCFYRLAAQPAYPPTPPALQNITTVEYFIDSDPGFGSGTMVSTAALTNITQLVAANITGLNPGVHRFCIRSKDAGNFWSITNAVTFENFNPAYPSAPATLQNITSMEYFIDADPGFGSGTAVSTAALTDVTQLIAANITGLNPGVHRFFIRSKDANNKWGIINAATFENLNPAYPSTTATANITKMEYFITNSVTPSNSDPGFGLATDVPLTAATNINSMLVVVDFGGVLPSANRNLFIRTKDANGKWGFTNTAQFNNSLYIYPSVPAVAPNLQDMEYFIDNDPGFGAGTAVSFTPSADLNNFSFLVNGVDTLTAGNHQFFIRSRQSPWSLTLVVPFTRTAPLALTWAYVMAQLQNTTGIISWGTAQESNSKEFVIEHSNDGIHFSTLGVQPAAGNSSTAKNYSCQHNNIPAGINYYRIRQVDINGSFSYSAIVTLLNKNGLTKTILAPNPANNYTLLVFSNPTKKAAAIIFSVSGQMLKTMAIPDGLNQQLVDLSALPKGEYSIRVFNGNSNETLPFIKQ